MSLQTTTRQGLQHPWEADCGSCVIMQDKRWRAWLSGIDPRQRRSSFAEKLKTELRANLLPGAKSHKSQLTPFGSFAERRIRCWRTSWLKWINRTARQIVGNAPSFACGGPLVIRAAAGYCTDLLLVMPSIFLALLERSHHLPAKGL